MVVLNVYKCVFDMGVHSVHLKMEDFHDSPHFQLHWMPCVPSYLGDLRGTYHMVPYFQINPYNQNLCHIFLPFRGNPCQRFFDDHPQISLKMISPNFWPQHICQVHYTIIPSKIKKFMKTIQTSLRKLVKAKMLQIPCKCLISVPQKKRDFGSGMPKNIACKVRDLLSKSGK